MRPLSGELHVREKHTIVVSRLKVLPEMPEGKIMVAPRPLSRFVPTPVEAHRWSSPMRRQPSRNRLPATAGVSMWWWPPQRPAAAAPLPTRHAASSLPRATGQAQCLAFQSRKAALRAAPANWPDSLDGSDNILQDGKPKPQPRTTSTKVTAPELQLLHFHQSVFKNVYSAASFR